MNLKIIEEYRCCLFAFELEREKSAIARLKFRGISTHSSLVVFRGPECERVIDLSQRAEGISCIRLEKRNQVECGFIHTCNARKELATVILESNGVGAMQLVSIGARQPTLHIFVEWRPWVEDKTAELLNHISVVLRYGRLGTYLPPIASPSPLKLFVKEVTIISATDITSTFAKLPIVSSMTI